MFAYDPPVPSAASREPFFQTLRLLVGEQEIARARWHIAGAPAQGVIQLVELFVHPAYRRQGFGGRALREVFRQAQSAFAPHKCNLRRVWLAAEQKSQVIARAFLTSHGFHHVATVPEVLNDEDLLVYSKTFD